MDIRMGKPGRRHGLSSDAEYIGVRKRTEGTETSKYLQEKKSNETPLVVASECGLAQTSRFPAGVVGARHGTVEASRTAWEGRPERVRAPYAKAEAALGIPRVRRDTRNPV
jgi:hypothetical protein